MDQQRIIWVTGATSGIGYSLTCKLLAQGNTVIATARHLSKLESLQSKYTNKLYTYQLDVSDESDVQTFCDNLEKQFDHIDTMILNAGICEYVEWPNLDLNAMHRNMDTNFWGVVNCISHGLKLLATSKTPYIVAVSSAAQIVGLPRAEGYGASKAALHYFLETVQTEIYKSNIKLSIVTPGFVATELTAKNDFPMPFLIPVEKATDIILKGMRKQKPEISFPCSLILILKLLSILPFKIKTFLLSRTIRSK